MIDLQQQISEQVFHIKNMLQSIAKVLGPLSWTLA
jgi:hypothetical protein